VLERSRRRLFWPFVLPALLLYLVVLIVPMLRTIYFSFTDVTQAATYHFVGLSNYRHALHDPFFWAAMRHTVVFTLVGGALLFGPGLFMAWSLSQPIRLRRFYRTVIFAPVVMSVLVAALLWKFLLDPNWGLINGILSHVGLGSLTRIWLGDTRTALLAVTVATIWHGIGLWVVLISAGLERIPVELFEAARIDGANDRQQFLDITLPLVWTVLANLIILWVIQAMQTFAFVFVMTKGGPINATEVAATYVYGIAFTSQQFGYGTALATLLMVVIFAFTVVTVRLVRREAHQF
jgi:ABC-type sugar transport system permease subunit